MLKETLRNSLVAIFSPQELQRWFDPLSINLDETSGTLVVTFPHAFFGSWFEARRDLFEGHMRSLLGTHTPISYVLPQQSMTETPKIALIPPPFAREWNFDTFIANAKHKLALSVLRENPLHDPRSACPLLLGGATSTGKTHLLRATANLLTQSLGEAVYCSTADEVLSLLHKGPLQGIRELLYAQKAILLDNIHRISQSALLQNELLLLLDHASDQGRPVILAGTGHISTWSVPRDLRVRLEMGLWVELPEPDLDIRLRFVQTRLKERRANLNKDQALLLAQTCTDMRVLNGIICRIMAHRVLVGRDLTDRDIETILRQRGDTSPLTSQFIVALVGERCGFSPKELLGEKRRPDLVQARQTAMFLCRELLGHSYPVIGHFFGGKDHSTVMHAVKKIKLLQERDRVTNTLLTELTKTCQEQRE